MRQLLKIITQFLPIALKAELNWRWNRILAMRDSLAPVERGAMSFPRHACYEHLREILPELDRPDAKAIEIGGSTGVIKGFFQQLRKVSNDRDRELALAINSADIEIVTSAPTDEPDYGAPCLKLYDDGSDWHLYCYVGGDGWKYVTLT